MSRQDSAIHYRGWYMKKQKYNEGSKDIPPELERYVELCIRMYERMERENSWPWVKEKS